MPNNMPDARAINEALRRAREMQSRSETPAQPQPEHAPEHTAEHTSSAPEQPAQTSAAQSPPASLLDHLMQDKERALILALLVLLAGENGSTELLFALLYLLI